MRRSPNVIPQLRERIADAPQTGLEVLRLVLVVVNSQDVEVLSGKIDDLLAPDHVVGPLLSTRHDSCVGNDGAQPAAVSVHNFGIPLRREAVVHGLVVNLETPGTVGLGMPVGRAQAAPFRGRRIIQVVNPVYGVLNLLGICSGRRQYDKRLGVQLPAKSHKLLSTETVVIRVAAPNHVGMVSARDKGADAVLPLVGGSKRASRPTDKRRSEISQSLQQVWTEHAFATDIRAH